MEANSVGRHLARAWHLGTCREEFLNLAILVVFLGQMTGEKRQVSAM
jgi:hypothetical protein